MNQAEREKTRALRSVWIARPTHRRFVGTLIYVLEKEPRSVLTPAQKYYLDLLTWVYRKQIAGLDEGIIPESKPEIRDYMNAAEKRKCRQRQQELF